MYIYFFLKIAIHVTSTVIATVGCPRGTYQGVGIGERVFNGEGVKERYQVCRQCPVSSYQDQISSVDCKICPEYYQTRGPGSTSSNDCYGELLNYYAQCPN